MGGTAVEPADRGTLAITRSNSVALGATVTSCPKAFPLERIAWMPEITSAMVTAAPAVVEAGEHHGDEGCGHCSHRRTGELHSCAEPCQPVEHVEVLTARASGQQCHLVSGLQPGQFSTGPLLQQLLGEVGRPAVWRCQPRETSKLDTSDQREGHDGPQQ